MLIPIIVSSVFVLAVLILCLIKPNAGRIFLGLFFLVMAIGVNGSFTFTNPQAYVEYASGALIPLYRDIALTIVELNPVLFGLLCIIRAMPTSESDGCRPPVPGHADHLFRRHGVHFSGTPESVVALVWNQWTACSGILGSVSD